jgi:hypothetical protein
MQSTRSQRVGQVVAASVVGGVLLLVLVAAGAAALARQRRVVPDARSATAAAASTGLSTSQAALQPPVKPVPAPEQTLILVASPEQAAAVTEQLDQVRSVVPSLQAEVLVVSPTADVALAASLQQRVLVDGYALGPVIDLRSPQ